MISEVYNEDCMLGMARFPDKFFDLAIVDPPYGIGAGTMKMGKGKKAWTAKNWDEKKQGHNYFDELFRLSARQIIWGANHFRLPLSAGWIFWDKVRNKSLSFSDGELAWTNFLSTIRKVCIQYDGFLGADNGYKIHPTQKPIKLYKWLLTNYAKPGMKILDTHMGSQSSRIAAYQLGFDFWGWEIDRDYFEAGNKRFREQTAQTDMFKL